MGRSPKAVAGDRWPQAQSVRRWAIPRPDQLTGLVGYLLLRVRFPALRVRLFLLERGAQIRIGPAARLQFGRGIRISRDFSAHWRGRVTIGDRVFFNRGCTLVCHEAVTIGDHAIFGEYVSIHDEGHSFGGDVPVRDRALLTAPITIGRNVWVGAKSTILPGVSIGEHAVIGANAVVNRDIPARVLAAGVPARVIRQLEGS